MRELVEANKANIPTSGSSSSSTEVGSAEVAVGRDPGALGGGGATAERGGGGAGGRRGGELGSDAHDEGDAISHSAAADASAPSADSGGGDGRQGSAWGRLAGIFR